MLLHSKLAGYRPGRATWVLGGALLALTALVATAGLTSRAWGESLRDEERLLPGTTIGSVDVGDHTVPEAIDAVEARFEPLIERPVEVVHGEHRWRTSAAELGATTDVAEVVARAFEHTTAAGLTELTRMRWTGAAIGPELGVSMGIPDGAAEDFVAAIAGEIDRDPRDAEVVWADDAFELEEDRDGREVDTTATAEALLAAFDREDVDTVELELERQPPELTTERAREAIDELTPLVDAALDHTVTVSHEGSSWSVTPRALDAVPDVGAGLEAALEGELPEGAVAEFVASVASEVDVAPRDAQLDWDSDGEMTVVPERDGLAVQRDETTSALRRALDGASDAVQLTVGTARASVTTSSFDRVLLLRQDERMLYLYENHERVREWPVAVGQGGSPTPTGTFTIGAKRFEPTWHNPSPGGWGSDMPASIGPGPNNPLGTRALNWNDHGRDTLIRFHGTPNEDSIGRAASQGCVRMYNADVQELYDLVPSGTVIVSTS